ncbi:MAG: hypothetical protein WAX44_03770 [Minisyncoccia bacterium]
MTDRELILRIGERFLCSASVNGTGKDETPFAGFFLKKGKGEIWEEILRRIREEGSETK